MLYAERKRREEQAAREAAGQSLWTEEIDQPVRVKIAHVWETYTDAPWMSDEIARKVAAAIQRHLGLMQAADKPYKFVSLADTDLILSHIEAVCQALNAADRGRFQEDTNAIFNAHRIAFRMINGDFVPFKSDELHTEVIEPTLTLLSGRPELAQAHACYMKALKEISGNDPADAITDAGTALQEALTALGCDGNVLGVLVASAKKKGLLGPRDSKLTESIEQFGVWAASERNNTGDTHHDSPASLADAWLMVHIVGALIVRLADPKPRPSV